MTLHPTIARWVSTPYRRGSLLLAAAFLLAAPPLAAQENLEGDFSSKPAIEKRLAEVELEIRGLQAGGDPGYEELLRRLEAACQAHLSSLEFTAEAKKEADAAAEAARSWTGFAEAPPYPITRIDGIRDRLADLDESRIACEATLRIIARAADGARDRLAQHQQIQRRLQDMISGPSGNQPDRARELERERLTSRIEAEEIASLDVRKEGQRAVLAGIGSRQQLAQLQLATAQKDAGFSQQDLDGILARLENERSRAVANRGRREGDSADNTLLTWKLEFLELEIEFWKKRFAAFHGDSRDLREETLADFKSMKSRVDDWVRIGQLQTPDSARVAAMTLDPDALREALRLATGFQRRIGFAIDDLGGKGERGRPLLEIAKDRIAALWNAELYLVEETSFIDGKKVTTARAVTVGKLIRLAVILTIGWLLLRWIARRVALATERRKRVQPATAALIARWFFIAGFAILLIYGMNVVHIPLAAFAFLGGALAIGVGFGAQTLVKNFISGLILIFERPVRIGDQVEVDGIKGRIRSIGMRSSVIQHFDGIDTLIPNSTLLENKVTNWTFNDDSLRQTIAVGVAYGSPTREVAKVMVAVAASHGLVKEDPAPEVRLEDFGDNALIFTLLFWFDARKTRRGPLASDLRFMIEKAFSEAGIAFAFPQRDVHFDAAAPLRVELARRPTETSETHHLPK